MLWIWISIGVILKAAKAISSGRGGRYLTRRYAHKSLSRMLR